MKIEYLDGKRLQQAVIAGARRVILMQDKLNRMNVFPVPDNDTGTNMALTMQSIAEGAISCRDKSISGMSRCLAEAALMGARGNSGAILAQFFQGLYERLQGMKVATVSHFSEAVEQARKSAYEALTEPREGTILTVIHDWAERIKSHCHVSHDFLDVFKAGLHEAQRSLMETPKKLKLLARAGVVDAGAQGFVHMLEGILHFMQTGKIDQAVGMGGNHQGFRAKVENASEDIQFQFCTECFVEGQKIDRLRFRRQLQTLGNSLIVAGSAQKIRVHIHTNEPQAVFAVAEKYGTVSKQKYDDMRKQHERAYGPDETIVHKIAIVTDSSCDLPPEFVIRHNIQTVPIQVSFGSQNFIDKITITPKEFYRMLTENGAFPKTSQPTPGDFAAAYEALWGHYDRGISIHLSGALSGTLQAAQTAARTFGEDKLTVVDGCTTSIALGLIVAEAARAVEEGLDFEAVLKRVEAARKSTRFFVACDTVKYLILGGRLNKSRGFAARLLNLKPVLTFTQQGEVKTIARIFGGRAAMKKLLHLTLKEASGKKKLRFAVGHTNAPEKAAWLEERLKKHFETNHIMKINVSPALGAHAGPGATGIAFLGE